MLSGNARLLSFVPPVPLAVFGVPAAALVGLTGIPPRAAHNAGRRQFKASRPPCYDNGKEQKADKDIRQQLYYF